MDAIEQLMAEHRIIESVISALDAYVARVAAGDDVPSEDAARFAEFFREYADRCHHGKEEDILFISMIEHGFQKEAGPLAVMYQEHDAGRAHVRGLREAASAGAWTPDSRDAVVEHGTQFGELLRAHIQKEDGILYPMATTHIPEARMSAMAGEFDAFNRDDVGTEVQIKLQALADELIALYP